MLQKPGKSDRVYTPTKLAAIIDAVVAGGVSPTHALAGVGVSQAELLSPHTRVSVQQVLIACGNAIRLSRDPSLAFRAGASMHVSSFGMYGFAILSSADFRKTMSFCERYHVLATPLVMLRFREEHGLGIWSIGYHSFSAERCDGTLTNFETVSQEIHHRIQFASGSGFV
jgi:hypothetical protein